MTDTVLDASVTAGWLLDDENSAATDQLVLLKAGANWLAPANWLIEVESILLRSERRGRLTPNGVRQARVKLGSLRVEIDETAAALVAERPEICPAKS